MYEKLKNTDIDYSGITVYIPDVMNALYNTAASKHIHLNEIRDMFRGKMMQSKAWLISKFLQQQFPRHKTLAIIGGWLGFTSWTLFKHGYANITEIDCDPRVGQFSQHLNRFNPQFTHITADVNDLDLSEYDIVVNTSCEHISDNRWFTGIRPGAHIVLQSNNIAFHDHVNTVSSTQDMLAQYPMTLSYSGELDLGDNTSRFMLIGSPGAAH
jgi:hypothetical protein